MGTKWGARRDYTMSKKHTTPGELVCLLLIGVITIAWLLFAGIQGQENKQDRLKDEGTIPPKVCTEDLGCTSRGDTNGS